MGNQMGVTHRYATLLTSPYILNIYLPSKEPKIYFRRDKTIYRYIHKIKNKMVTHTFPNAQPYLLSRV